MTTESVITHLTKERDDLIRQIVKREKEIAHFSERLKHAQMPNQVAILKAQRSRQITMLDADEGVLVDLERSLAAEISSQV